jgi:hypothetical protein
MTACSHRRYNEEAIPRSRVRMASVCDPACFARLYRTTPILLMPTTFPFDVIHAM